MKQLEHGGGDCSKCAGGSHPRKFSLRLTTAGPLPPTGDGSMSPRTLADLAFSPAFWFDASFALRNSCKSACKSTVVNASQKRKRVRTPAVTVLVAGVHHVTCCNLFRNMLHVCCMPPQKINRRLAWSSEWESQKK